MSVIVTILIFYAGALFFFTVGIVVHELGHLAFGLLTGYSFVSFKLRSFVFTRENGKLTLGRDQNKSILGQCLMSPPEDESKFHFVLYNLGGGIFNLLLAFLTLAASQYDAGYELYGQTMLVGCMINAFLGLMNLVPLSLTIPNDGLNVITALKSPEAKHGLFLMLRINEQTTAGMRYREIAPDLLKVSADADLSNYLIANTAICEAERLYDLGDHTGSIAALSRLDLDRLQSYYANSARVDILYHAIVHEPDYEKARALLALKDMQKFLNTGFPAANRTLAAFAFFVDGKQDVGRRMFKQTGAMLESHPNKGLKRMESDYLDTLDKAMRAAEKGTKKDETEAPPV